MELELRLTEADIAEAVESVAQQIDETYDGETVLMVGIMKGSFVFLADLVRAMSTPVEIDFVRARSYGKGTTTSGAVEITKDIETDVMGRHVIVVEDILDTGLTMDVVVERLEIGDPESVRRCSLLVREGSVEPEFWGRHIGPGFVVGYGIDYAEKFRGLRDIRVIPGT